MTVIGTSDAVIRHDHGASGSAAGATRSEAAAAAPAPLQALELLLGLTGVGALLGTLVLGPRIGAKRGAVVGALGGALGGAVVGALVLATRGTRGTPPPPPTVIGTATGSKVVEKLSTETVDGTCYKESQIKFEYDLDGNGWNDTATIRTPYDCREERTVSTPTTKYIVVDASSGAQIANAPTNADLLAMPEVAAKEWFVVRPAKGVDGDKVPLTGVQAMEFVSDALAPSSVRVSADDVTAVVFNRPGDHPGDFLSYGPSATAEDKATLDEWVKTH